MYSNLIPAQQQQMIVATLPAIQHDKWMNRTQLQVTGFVLPQQQWVQMSSLGQAEGLAPIGKHLYQLHICKIWSLKVNSDQNQASIMNKNPFHRKRIGKKVPVDSNWERYRKAIQQMTAHFIIICFHGSQNLVCQHKKKNIHYILNKRKLMRA